VRGGRPAHELCEAAAVPVVGIDHVQLAIPPGREEEATAFYEGLLGLPRVPKPAPLASRGGCWFEADGVKVHLGIEADFRPARKAHPALLVADLDELCRRLTDAGVEVREGDDPSGRPQRYVDDPFGNRIELVG
jgi:catechol 2,3-dioxygenase-like lactoylglutathione lyase family enzyme